MGQGRTQKFRKGRGVWGPQAPRTQRFLCSFHSNFRRKRGGGSGPLVPPVSAPVVRGLGGLQYPSPPVKKTKQQKTNKTWPKRRAGGRAYLPKRKAKTMLHVRMIIWMLGPTNIPIILPQVFTYEQSLLWLESLHLNNISDASFIISNTGVTTGDTCPLPSPHVTLVSPYII